MKELYWAGYSYSIHIITWFFIVNFFAEVIRGAVAWAKADPVETMFDDSREKVVGMFAWQFDLPAKEPATCLVTNFGCWLVSLLVAVIWPVAWPTLLVYGVAGFFRKKNLRLRQAQEALRGQDQEDNYTL